MVQVLSPPKKRPAKHFTVEDKVHVLNIFKAYNAENADKLKTEIVEFTANAAGVSVQSVFKILREYKETHELHPPKVYHRQRRVLDNIDDVAKNALRRCIHSFFEKNEPPTLNKILETVNQEEHLPQLKRSTLSKLINEIGFRYSKRSRNSVLREKNEIIAWRRRFLREIRKYREEGRKFYFLDETWVNAGHTVSKVWKDTTILTPRQAFIQGLTTGLKDPTGKGNRIIVLHIGSEDGFVEDGLLCFESKKTGDYHEEMTGEVFEHWFSNILGRLDEHSVIVMDNASYHSRKTEKIPNTGTKKAEIQAWLTSRSIAYEEDMVRAELLQLVRQAAVMPTYVVDEMAKEHGHLVLRLPPYHCEFNPIELIWAQIKGEVARKNTTFKMKDLHSLFEQAVVNVSAENWKNAIRHAQGEEEKMWQLDTVMDIAVEPLIIHLGNDSSSSDSESD